MLIVKVTHTEDSQDQVKMWLWEEDSNNKKKSKSFALLILMLLLFLSQLKWNSKVHLPRKTLKKHENNINKFGLLFLRGVLDIDYGYTW
jgi:hypothetical protein